MNLHDEGNRIQANAASVMLACGLRAVRGPNRIIPQCLRRHISVTPRLSSRTTTRCSVASASFPSAHPVQCARTSVRPTLSIAKYSHHARIYARDKARSLDDVASDDPHDLSGPPPPGAATEISPAVLTPMLKQWQDVKQEFPDYLVLFQMGDFYECFFEDADRASALLNITLTKRANVPMAGIPLRALPVHLKRLVLTHGTLVALCEQVESPQEARRRAGSGPALVSRQVTRLITPGTLIEESFLDPTANNFCAAIAHSSKTDLESSTLALAWTDISTGDFSITTTTLDQLSQDLARIGPREVVTSEELLRFHPTVRGIVESSSQGSKYTTLLTVRPAATFSNRQSTARLQEAGLLGRALPQSQGDTEQVSALERSAAHGLLQYISYTQRGNMPQLCMATRQAMGSTVSVDVATRRSLELTQSWHTVSYAHSQTALRRGLLGAIDRTTSASGARLLASRVSAPLTTVSDINARLNLVDYFRAQPVKTRETRSLLSRVHDMERCIQRLSLSKGGPRDLASIAATLELGAELQALLKRREHRHRVPVSLPPGSPGVDYEGLSRFDSDSHFKECSQSVTNIAKRLTHPSCVKVREELKRVVPLDRMLPVSADSGGFVNTGYSQELDRQVDLRDNSKQLVRDLQLKYQTTTGWPGLKIKSNNIVGYYVCLTRPQLRKIASEVVKNDSVKSTDPLSEAERIALSDALPDWFIKCGELSTEWRFKTEDLRELQEHIAQASDRSIQLELDIFNQCCDAVLKAGPRLMDAAHALAEIDVAAANAHLSVTRHYTRPIILESTLHHDGNGPMSSQHREDVGSLISSERPVFHVKEGRHPLVETALGESIPFVGNDCWLDEQGGTRVWLVTGPNMSGKSTFLRQNAAIALLGQAGLFVPADYACFTVVDKVFSRVGATDNIGRDKSTFMMEMLETTQILRSATPLSLVLMDEVGRGTSTFDGVAIAMATLEHLHNVNRCRAMFASHYHELHYLTESLPNLACRHVAVDRDSSGDVVFVHRLRDGVCDQSYGVHVARLAGMPETVAARADHILGALSDVQAQYKDSLGKVFRPGLDGNSHGRGE